MRGRTSDDVPEEEMDSEMDDEDSDSDTTTTEMDNELVSSFSAKHATPSNHSIYLATPVTRCAYGPLMISKIVNFTV